MLDVSGAAARVADPVALGPMSADQIRSIITGPAEAEGL